MVVLHEVEGHVSGYIHGSRVVLEPCEVQRIASRYVQLSCLAHRAWVEGRLHGKVVAERHVVLSRGRVGRQYQHGRYGKNLP